MVAFFYGGAATGFDIGFGINDSSSSSSSPNITIFFFSGTIAGFVD
jgi:hypothetical protein